MIRQGINLRSMLGAIYCGTSLHLFTSTECPICNLAKLDDETGDYKLVSEDARECPEAERVKDFQRDARERMLKSLLNSVTT